mgnify:CR=1 FL=1
MIKKILYVLIFLIVLFCAFYTNSDELYMWMYILLGVPLLSFALLGIASLRLKYTESIDNKTVTRGDNVNYRLKIHNEDFFMYPLYKPTFTWTIISAVSCFKPDTTFSFLVRST